LPPVKKITPQLFIHSPAAVEPTALAPAVVEPMVVEPMVVEPMVVEPMAVEPMAAEPMVVEPTVAPTVVAYLVEYGRRRRAHIADLIRQHAEDDAIRDQSGWTKWL
jgi:hypothetical protein